MRIGLFLYRSMTWLFSPFIPLLMRYRVAQNKESAAAVEARFAKNLAARPNGTLIWLHGASVGESNLLLMLADALEEKRSDLKFLHTSQTLTSATLISSAIREKSNRLYYPAPIDTPFIASRFTQAWKPNLAIFAEGEIWPNLLDKTRRSGAKTALINARMTKASLRGWARWPRTANTVFGEFDLIAASDEKTAEALRVFAPHTFALPANLKSDLPPPEANEADITRFQASIGSRPVLLAASTHPGEEALVLEATTNMVPKPFLILAPRHPERGDEIERLCHAYKQTVSRRSTEEEVTYETDILLADTIGEMGLWLRLCDTVYLGGGHAPGIGGHNPFEAIKLGKPVVTGPNVFNFTDIMNDFQKRGGLSFVESAADLTAIFPAAPPPTMKSYRASPLSILLERLHPLLPPLEARNA